jgi:LPXTG-motif cell wall-anchored protein
VNVTAAGVDVATTTIADAPNSTGFTLPLTGGTGTLILTVLGAGLLVAVLVIARRRRAREDQAA